VATNRKRALYRGPTNKSAIVQLSEFDPAAASMASAQFFKAQGPFGVTKGRLYRPLNALNVFFFDS